MRNNHVLKLDIVCSLVETSWFCCNNYNLFGHSVVYQTHNRKHELKSSFIRGIVHDKNIDRTNSKWRKYIILERKLLLLTAVASRNMPFNYRKNIFSCVRVRVPQNLRNWPTHYKFSFSSQISNTISNGS